MTHREKQYHKRKKTTRWEKQLFFPTKIAWGTNKGLLQHLYDEAIVINIEALHSDTFDSQKLTQLIDTYQLKTYQGTRIHPLQ